MVDLDALCRDLESEGYRAVRIANFRPGVDALYTTTGVSIEPDGTVRCGTPLDWRLLDLIRPHVEGS